MSDEEFTRAAAQAVTSQLNRAQEFLEKNDLRNALRWIRTSTRTLEKILELA